MLCFLGLGIASAAYAASWGEPPETCTDRLRDLSETGDNDDDVCDSVALNITNSLQAVRLELRSYMYIRLFTNATLQTNDYIRMTNLRLFRFSLLLKLECLEQ